MSTAFWVLLALFVGYSLGWGNAHYSIATECDRLGSFFVGKRVFKCTEITEVKK